jgi:hypothetical protein
MTYGLGQRRVHFFKKFLSEIGLSGVGWIGVAKDRYRRALVNEVMNLRVPLCWETTEWLHNFWFSSGAQLHTVS